MPAPAPAPVRYKPRDPAVLRLATRVAGAAATRERPIETSVLCQLLRGASTADVAAMYEPALAAADLDELVTETTDAHRTWAAESLDHLDVVYLYLEAIPQRAAAGDAGERDLLAAWGVTRHGRRVLLGLRQGDRDRATAWGALGADLVERGMHPPVLIVADGAPGVWRVARELWPDAALQQSLSHALAEAADGLSANDARDLRTRVSAVLEDAKSVAEANDQLESIVDELRDESPARMAVLGRRIERLTAHLAFPAEHRRRLRSADALQRALGELGSVDAPVALVWAVLTRNTEAARRMAMSLHAAAQLDQLRRNPTPVHNHDASVTEA
jgi:transposase-like protein